MEFDEELAELEDVSKQGLERRVSNGSKTVEEPELEESGSESEVDLEEEDEVTENDSVLSFKYLFNLQLLSAPGTLSK